MTLRGHIRNGMLLLDEPPQLPEGTAVEVELRKLDFQDPRATLSERYHQIIGIAPNLPSDFSINHDHYIHGTPKRGEP